MAERTIITEEISREGISLRISYERDWLNMGEDRPEYSHAHIEVRSIAPDRAQLPITETGYRSHFLHPWEVEEAGGATAFVLGWLDDAARSPEWRATKAKLAQPDLFR